ncbi:MAG: integrase arm-type DNA-binding domain-containing protein [Pseudomonadota bacterium]
MRIRSLTVAGVERLRPDPTRRLEVPDGIVSGLYLIIQPKGNRSWALRYRHHGRTRKLTLGKYPTVGLLDARERARDALGKVQIGEDPGAEKRTSGSPSTVEEAYERYLSEHCKPNVKRWLEVDRLFKLHVLPDRKDIALEELTKWDVRETVRAVVEAGKPVQANRVLAAMRAFLNWTVSEDLLEANPANGVKRPTKEKVRDRVLTDAELHAILEACDDHGYPSGPLVKMLALTGQRRDEVRCLPWSEIDLEKKLWTLPAARTKAGRRHIVPLSDEVVDILEALPRFDGPYAFTTTGGETSYANLVKPKRSIDKASGVSNWTLHDLRRTAATGMGALGIPGETIARVLNHSERAIAGITARYEHSDHIEAKRRGLEAWAQHVAGLSGDNVVQLREPA